MSDDREITITILESLIIVHPDHPSEEEAKKRVVALLMKGVPEKGIIFIGYKDKKLLNLKYQPSPF